MSGPAELPAGRFSSWLVRIQDPGGTDVPCGTCTACCTSAQFVEIGPDENETLARIPRELLFPAPGRPPGHVVLGYDQRGHCPMLRDGGCTIYEHRPRTCRTYDCRVFPASGVDVGDDPAKAAIAERAGGWRFDHPTAQDADEHAAVRAAAAFLRAHTGDLPAGAVPRPPTQLAYLAVRVHHLFLGGATPAVERVERELP